ncbi:MAG: response regulator transcription factor [Flavobacteriales bacterium]|nr:response regulator transcription factor [Flavobacteriales bacterium]
MNVLIVEDEVLISENLRNIIVDSGNDVCGVFASLNATEAFLQNNHPDCAFVDIRLAGVDHGIVIGKILRNKNIPFIYLTSFSDKETLKNAVETEPQGYLLKPFEPEEIQEVLRKFSNAHSNKLVIKTSSEVLQLPIKDIMYLKSDNVYLEIYTKTQRWVVREKLEDVLQGLPEQQFIRVHRSYAVNKDFVFRFSKSEIVIGEISIPVSKKYKSLVQERF